jgi:AmmeMemoRadiSam system protein A
MPDLSSDLRRTLLQLARNSIQIYLTSGDKLNFQTDLPEFNLRRGCFITLRKAGELRGCVGTFDASEVLYKNIIRMAVAAAFQDTRFPPLGKDEFSQVKIEISVLGELEKIQSLDEIELGKHGVYIKLGHRSGTFLPEVAAEQGWSVQEFVMACAREKARLSTDEISRAEIYRYPVEKFKE